MHITLSYAVFALANETPGHSGINYGYAYFSFYMFDAFLNELSFLFYIVLLTSFTANCYVHC